jgi:hypothetical protein
MYKIKQKINMLKISFAYRGLYQCIFLMLFFLFYFGYAQAASSPTISSISPANGPRGGATPVTITGTGFFETREAKPDLNSFSHVWYVSTTGSDTIGDGSQSHPYASLNKAVTRASNGDGIYILAGTYRAMPNIVDLSATVDASHCIFDLDKDLHIFGDNMDTIIECYGSDTTTRDANVVSMSNISSILSNLKINYYPNRNTSYSNAIFARNKSVVRNIFVENKSTTTNWSYVYDNNNYIYNVYNSTFKSNGRSIGDYSGNPTYTNCLFDATPSRGSKNYSLTRVIVEDDWNSSTLPVDLRNTGDPGILNPDDSRSHIGVSGGVYAWNSYPFKVFFGGIESSSVTFINETTINALTPAYENIEPVDVTVKNPDTQSATLVDGFTYEYDDPAPTISNILPSSGSKSGGTNITITGTGFIGMSGELPDLNSFSHVWYISTTGSDTTGDGSQTNSYATLKKAVDMASNGDGIYFLSGTYHADPQIIERSYGVASACLFDLGKDLHIFGDNMNTVIECHGSDTTTRDGNAVEITNASSTLSNLKINYYPNRSTNYSNAIFAWSRGIVRNIFVENKSTTVDWSYVYDNDNSPFFVYNSIFKSNGRNTMDYSGNPTYTNCLFDVTPSRGFKNYSITRTIVEDDWNANILPASLKNLGDPATLNSDGSRSHIGVLGGKYGWGINPSIFFDAVEVHGITIVDSTTLSMVTPAYENTGSVDVTVKNPDTQSITLVEGFTYNADSLESTTIQNPTPTKISQAVNDGYFTLNTGTVTNTDSVTAQVNITLTNNGKEVTFPQNTTIQETNTNPFNFQNFTLESQNIKNEQPESRSAFRLGIEGTNLTFSQPITITTFIGEAFNNQTLDILYQNEGETTWNTQGTCTVENGQCTFTTDHATIYTINGTLQSTGDAPLNINTEVLDTLTMDCYESTNGSGTYDVVLGTTTTPGTVTAGTPAIGQSTCTVTTNDDQGYYLTVEDDNGISSTVLTHTDPNTGTLYEIQDLTHWNDTTLTTENWNPPTTKGLGFSIITFPDTDTSNNIFDGIWTETGNCPEGTTSDSNDYAGFPNTPQTIAAVPQYTANHTTTNICYKVDVPTSQPSGTYTGSVTYTATSDASSYLN